MRRDPHIRSYNDTPPLFYGPGVRPGTVTEGRVWYETEQEESGWAMTKSYAPVRFRWPEEWDEDVATIRREIQDGGPGLFVLRDPFRDDVKYLVEAQYPDKIRDGFVERSLDPGRKYDMGMGRLVVVGNDLAPGRTPLVWSGSIHPMAIKSIRKGNRRVRADLKRTVTASYHKLELEDHHEREGEEVIEQWSAMYADAYVNTLETMKPKVSMAGAYN